MNGGDDLQALLGCLRDIRGYETASRSARQEPRANGIHDAMGRLAEPIIARFPDQEDVVMQILSRPNRHENVTLAEALWSQVLNLPMGVEK